MNIPTRWTRRIYVHGADCRAADTNERRDCTCNLRKPEYDSAWVFAKELEAHV